MPRNGHNLSINLGSTRMPASDAATATVATAAPPDTAKPVLEWDWDVEHEDRKLEAKADAASQPHLLPFQVDRKVLKDIVREKMGIEVGRIKFLSLGTFHKAYLVTLANTSTLVARVARRFMPRLKTDSEVATMQYLRQHTSIPVPKVFYYDSNPYNRLGGEYILMSKAPGIPLSKVYHSLAHAQLVKLLQNLALLIVPLFSHRFSHIGSLYFGSSLPLPHMTSSSTSTPKAGQFRGAAFPFSLSMSAIAPLAMPKVTSEQVLHAKRFPNEAEFHVGPVISWPFFGSNRGELSHPNEIDRGPWSTTESYLISCAQREIDGVVRENEGKAAPHRLHLDPDEIRSSRHHHLKAVPGDESDDSDEWDLQECQEEWEGPGDVMYRDYRRMQRSTFLVAHLAQRVECVRQEMQRWIRVMERLGVSPGVDGGEEFGLDCHDLSLENIFVDEDDHSKITCIIDWESTTIRPLWACAHLPAFLQSSPFIADRFRDIVHKLSIPTPDPDAHQEDGETRENPDLAPLAHQWLRYEAKGTRLRMAHRCVEWDGWEEGLVESILGPEDQEEEWFVDADAVQGLMDGDGESEGAMLRAMVPSPPESTSDSEDGRAGIVVAGTTAARRKPFGPEKVKVQMLDTTGDICGGRGGELGRRLEAWLHVNEGDIVIGRRWDEGEEDVDYDGAESA